MTTATTPDPFSVDREPGEPPPEVKRDQWGRYLLPHPESGKLQSWTRATTFAKTVADTYNIMLYQNRLTAKGMAMRPDLYAEAATISPDHIDNSDVKKKLNKISDLAMEAAGRGSKARLGTALHAFTEKVDAKEKITIPAPWDADVKAYATKLKEQQIKIAPEFIEAVVIVPSLGVAGTLDRLGWVPDWGEDMAVLDLKTGHSVQYAWMEIACQLFLYSRASHIYNVAKEELIEMPKVNQDKGLVIHLPVGDAECELYEIDLQLGGRVAAVSEVVRELRKRKDFSVPFTTSFAAAAAIEEADVAEAEQVSAEDGTDEWGDPIPQEPKVEKQAESGKIAEKLVNARDAHQEWVAAGIDFESKKRFQVAKLQVSKSKTEYVLVDIKTGNGETHALRRDAVARRKELEDALIDDSHVKPVGVELDEFEQELVDADADAKNDDWDTSGSDVDDSVTAEANEWATQEAGKPAVVEVDEWDTETAGEPPKPQTKTVEVDEWGEPIQAAKDDEEAKEEAPGADEIARLKEELAELRRKQTVTPPPVEAEEMKPKKSKAAVILEKILSAKTEEKLVEIYHEVGKTDWTDRMQRAAVSQKTKILAAEAAAANTDDDW